MTRICSICRHETRRAMERAIVHGQPNRANRAIARHRVPSRATFACSGMPAAGRNGRFRAKNWLLRAASGGTHPIAPPVPTAPAVVRYVPTAPAGPSAP